MSNILPIKEGLMPTIYGYTLEQMLKGDQNPVRKSLPPSQSDFVITMIEVMEALKWINTAHRAIDELQMWDEEAEAEYDRMCALMDAKTNEQRDALIMDHGWLIEEANLIWTFKRIPKVPSALVQLRKDIGDRPDD